MQNDECGIFFTTENTEFTEKKSFKNSVLSVCSVVKSFSDQENRLALAETFLVLRGMPNVRFGQTRFQGTMTQTICTAAQARTPSWAAPALMRCTGTRTTTCSMAKLTVISYMAMMAATF